MGRRGEGRGSRVRSRVPALIALAATTSACPRPAAPTPPPTSDTNVPADPATGDFSWSTGDVRHPMRAGAIFLTPGGGLDLVLAEFDARSPCALHDDVLDPTRGPERVYVHVPRGLDVEYPVHRAISPELLQLQPLERKKPNAGGRAVARYELELESLELRPGGRAVGRLAWVGVAPGAAPGIEIETFGEGRFDVPLCASRAAVDALAALPAPRTPALTMPVTGQTLTGPFTVRRAFADLRPWFGLPPHVTRLELYPDPFVTCATRATAKGTALLIDIDSGTGLGKHNGSRQPLSSVECRAGTTTWDCLGDAPSIRGFIEVSDSDLRVGGHFRGALALEGERVTAVAGTFDVEICGGD